MKVKCATKRAPLLELLEFQKFAVLRVVMTTFLTITMATFIVFSLADATGTIGVDRTAMLIIKALAVSAGIIFIPIAGGLSDCIGRHPVPPTATMVTAMAMGHQIVRNTYLTDTQKRTPGLGLIVLCRLVRSVMVGTSVHAGG